MITANLAERKKNRFRFDGGRFFFLHQLPLFRRSILHWKSTSYLHLEVKPPSADGNPMTTVYRVSRGLTVEQVLEEFVDEQKKKIAEEVKKIDDKAA